MEEQDIATYDGEHVRISYVAQHPTDRVDTAKLREEYPEVYENCIKTTLTKASVRITVKKNGTNQD